MDADKTKSVLTTKIALEGTTEIMREGATCCVSAGEGATSCVLAGEGATSCESAGEGATSCESAEGAAAIAAPLRKKAGDRDRLRDRLRDQFLNSVDIPGIANLVLGYLSPADQIETACVSRTFRRALPATLRTILPGILSAGHSLQDFITMLEPRAAPQRAQGCPWRARHTNEEVGPARAQLVWSLAAHACDIAGMRFSGASIQLPTPRHQSRPICGPRWLQGVGSGPFELLLSDRQGCCDRSPSLDACIRYVHDCDRHGVIHGYAVRVGSAESALLVRLGGRFAQARSAYVILVKTEEGLFLTILQVAPDGDLIECTGVLQIREIAPEPEESALEPEGGALESDGSPERPSPLWPPRVCRRQFTAVALSRRTLVGDMRKCVGICAYALVLAVMRAVYSGPLRCRAYTYTFFPATTARPDTLHTLVCRSPQLVETPGAVASPDARPDARPVLDGGPDPLGAIAAFDVEGLPDYGSPPAGRQSEAAAMELFVHICDALAHDFAAHEP